MCGWAALAFVAGGTQSYAANSLRGGAMSGVSGKSSSSPAATSQTATSATDQTSQSVATGTLAQQAQASMTRSIQALQAMQAAQAASRSAAISGANNLGLNPTQPGQPLPNVVDGLGGGAGLTGGLVPAGGLTAAAGSSIQILQLAPGANGALNLGKGGSVTLPKGTTGNDVISINGPGSVTATGGTVTATAGSVTTTTGGTISTASGGSIAVTAGSSTLSVITPTTITSTVAGIVTLAGGGQQLTLAAGTTVPLPAGSKVTFSGSTTGTVSITGAGDITLTGTGVLSLASSASTASAGGTITTNSGVTSFTSGVSTTLPAGSTINLTGAGSISVTSGTGGAVPVILPASATNYTTTGSILTSTGFVVPAGVSTGWVNVGALTQSVDPSTSHVTDTITQSLPQALLYWSQFDIGKNTTLSFDQSAGKQSVGQWVAINEITDPSLRPSQILGAIEAPGQVYVINQNGIIFGGSSQVNVHALTASSLPINTNLVAQGLLSGTVTDDQFLFSQLTINTLAGPSNPESAFVPPAAPAGGDGDVIVQSGAQLSSPTNAEHVGGRIALIGPVVDNEGTISVPDGQAILAAGLQVGLEAHSQNDPSLRGLDVYVGKVTDASYDDGATMDIYGTNLGSVTNGGDIESPRADVTMTGKQVNQNGVIDSSTSVSLNGRIDLLADYNSQVIDFNNVLKIEPASSGLVSFGENTLTQILPELASSDTVVGTSLALSSLVNVQGSSIHLGTGATLLAPGAALPTANPAVDLVGASLTSGVELNAGSWSKLGAYEYFLDNAGQVYLDNNSLIDVSGSADVAASVSENIIAVQLLGPELADSPLQQNGPLRGQTVDVDIRDYGVYDGQAYIGTPLADASGYVGLIQHDVGELTANGGSVAINAGQSVVIQPGAQVNVSGGYIDYAGGNVQTTQVATHGQVIDISQATPNLVYQGIYTGFSTTSAKWGITQTYANQLTHGTHYDAGYVQGGNAGTLTITAPTMALDGQLLGQTVAGSQQRSSAAQINSTLAGATFPGTNFESVLTPIFSAPQAGSLTLAFTQNQNPIDKVQAPLISPDVTFDTASDLAASAPETVPAFGLDASGLSQALPASRQSTVLLSQDLVNTDGFSNLTVDTSASGALNVPADVALTAAPGGSIALRGANITVAGTITAPSGTLNLVAYDVSPTAQNIVLPEPNFSRGNLTLEAGSHVSTAGAVVNDQLSSSQTQATRTTGGSITLNGFSVVLDSGSSVDVSGGVLVNQTGALTYGNAGSITVKGGLDPGGTALIGGNLTLGSSYLSGQGFLGYSGAGGGTLTVQAPLIQVGGTLPATEPEINIGNLAGDTGSMYTIAAAPVLLSADFFNQGGFAHFGIYGLGAELAPAGIPNGEYLPGVLLTAGTTVSPTVESLLPVFSGANVSLQPMTAQQAQALPASLRGPVSLTFATTDIALSSSQGFVSNFRELGQVDVQAGAVVDLTPNAQSSVTIKSDTVLFGGKVYVPGGQIVVGGSSGPEGLGLQPAVTTVDLRPGSVLSAQGQTQLSANLYGYRTGTVLNGGSVAITGDLVAEAGAVVDVSGWRDTLDVLPGAAGTSSSGLSAATLVPLREDSNGGTITLNGGEELYGDATLLGAAGGASAQSTATGLLVGNSHAQGGSVVVSANTVLSRGASATPTDVTLSVTQSDTSLPGLGAGGLGNSLVNASGTALTNGGGFITADRLDQGGFGTITLRGVDEFDGIVSLNSSASLNIATGGFLVGTDTTQLTLTAPYVHLGDAFATPATVQGDQQLGYIFTQGSNGFTQAPIAGLGELTVDASVLTDFGDLDLLGISTLNVNGRSTGNGFVATGIAGDIRGDGTLNIAGVVNLNAREIYPPTETTFTIAAYDANGGPGTVNLYRPAGAKLPSAPLSAGGTLNVYASVINDGGVLRAPIGTINLGWNGLGTAPANLISGEAVAPTQTLTLSNGSVVSVSASGQVIPYGSINAAGEWIDPAGNDITAGGKYGLPGKLVNVSAENVDTMSGATIDVSGGGDLYADAFVPGLGGTNNLATSTSNFAIAPGYSSDYAYAPFDAVSGYATSAYGGLQMGDQVQLAGANGLAAGSYTLLPAGYALLPGGFLLTPTGTAPGGYNQQTDGTQLVAGERTSGLDGAGEQAAATIFQVADAGVVQARAEYESALANTYFPVSAPENNVSVPRLPLDSGQVVIIATQNLTLPSDSTTLVSAPGVGGLGSEVDIASPIAINIESGSGASVAGDLNLSAASLNAFGADSLFIGGYRQTGTAGTTVTVLTDNLTLNNAGTALTGPDIILVSNQALTLDAGASINAGTLPAGAAAPVAPNLLLQGAGTLLRVSSDASAQVVRSGVVTSPTDPANLTIAAGASILGTTIGGATSATGGSIVLDSTNMTALDPSVALGANSLAINTGMMSIELASVSGPLSPAPAGLVLSSATLNSLQQTVQNLALQSYSSLDFYGSGSIGGAAVGAKFPVQSLSLHAAEIRGFNNGGGAVTINAQNVVLGGIVGGSGPGAVAASSGTLAINAQNVTLGGGNLAIDQFSQVTLSATQAVMLANGSGRLTTSDGLELNTPLVAAEPVVALTPAQEEQGATPETATSETISAGGLLAVTGSGTATASTVAGLGGNLVLSGSSVAVDSLVKMPSGTITVESSAGDVTISGVLNAAGTPQTNHDVTYYTDGGTVNLQATGGNVTLASGAKVDVSAPTGGGSAGALSVSATGGTFASTGASLLGTGGGSASFDLGTLASIDALSPLLTAGGFTRSQTIRVRAGNVSLDTTDTAQNFSLETDGGSITVTGKIDASGTTGGSISLAAAGSVSLGSGAVLTVEGKHFDDAGHGGSIDLEAGSDINGNFDPSALVNLGAGSTINLSVDAVPSATAAGFTGTLHIRAPQFADGSGLQVGALQGIITGASAISVEGYRIYTPAGGQVSAVEGSAAGSSANDGTVYGDAEGFTAHTASILTGLLQGTPNSSLSGIVQVVPGAEIINTALDSAAAPTQGDLVLSSNWDLSSFRFGPNHVAGDLTMRAGGNLVFDVRASLSDGFVINPADPFDGLWQATLLPAGSASWSYRLTAGADFSAAGHNQVLPETEMLSRDATGAPVLDAQGQPIYNGSLLLGQGATALPAAGSAGAVIPFFYQTIRTGTGSIEISAGGDVRLLNNLATIYTAGTAVADPTLGGTFQVPAVLQSQTSLGIYNPPYPVQYSDNGGNVSILAQHNIGHYNSDGSLDSSLELPDNWLYRQGSVSATGAFADTQGTTSVQSTSWWIDFSNFFEGVGALGGGNVTVHAGNDVVNVDAVVPTNARMPGLDAGGNATTPNASSLVEVGGGDLTVEAGNNISGGVYYVERGQGTLIAGNQILTNEARAAVLPGSSFGAPDPISFLPTTLYLGGEDGATGHASFSVSAGGDLLLGPVVNPFLQPQGLNNGFQEKSFFLTYAPSDAVTATSLLGNVTLQDSSDLAAGSLEAWYQNFLLSSPAGGAGTIADSEPWLGLVEDEGSVPGFGTVSSLMAPTLNVTAFTGDINIRGGLTLAPSPIGTINLVAAGSINGFQPNGQDGFGTEFWGSSTINLSDVNPANLPGIASPLAPDPTGDLTFGGGSGLIVQAISSYFTSETGASVGLSLPTQEALHDSDLLHAGDPTGPIHLYAGAGDISGVTLYSGKLADIVAGEDITDIAFYIQNVNSGDTSVVQAGRDILAYDANSPLRVEAQAPGNALLGSDPNDLLGTGTGAPNAGDIQIAGPGTLEILAGRNLNLGEGPSNGDGTGAGITSIGSSADFYLPFGGADIVAASGLGTTTSATNLAGSVGLNGLDFSDANGKGFIDQFLNPMGAESSRYLPDLANLLNLPPGTANPDVWADFMQLSTAQQDALAIKVFYLVLRDSGRDHNNPGIAGTSDYAQAYAAIGDLFQNSTSSGNISLTSREIKTTNGGDISLLARNGSIDVGLNNSGTQAVDQGILTVDGGNINIYADGDVNVGTSRIFTLHGGNEIIFSTSGNIDAGASSKTVQSAPPTRVLVYPTSGDVETDLAGLATGGGIGVLETVVGASAGDVDLVAPKGIVNAGDAGIRASGNLNIAAVQVLNASNIAVGGKSSGVPSGSSAPNIGALTAAGSTVGAALNAGANIAAQQNNQSLPQAADLPSIVTVEVVGYGGGDTD